MLLFDRKYLRDYQILGFIFLLIIYLPVFYLNKEMGFVIHDQFDGELLTYCLQAKYYDAKFIPELFCGTNKISMTPPAPLAVHLFAYLPSEWAIFIMHITILVVAYFGMFYLITELMDDRLIASLVSVLYCILPFYTVYGLSVMGQPALMYAFIRLWRNKAITVPILTICFFGMMSSLVLVGYADIFLLACFLIYGFVTKKSILKYSIGCVLLIAIYLYTNIELIEGILNGNTDFVTHKLEFVATHKNIFTAFAGLMWRGAYHAASRHQFILICLIMLILYTNKNKINLRTLDPERYSEFIKIGFAILSITIFHTFWVSKYIVDIRNELGGLFVAFAANRFYWLYPCLWFVMFAYIVYFLLRIFASDSVKAKKVLSIIVIFNFLLIWDHSHIKTNWFIMLKENYISGKLTSVNGFYQPTLFEEIKNYIDEDPRTYRVCSIGLFPSIALYNGFQCIDGYSNNYDIRYKHKFRKIIEGELDKLGKRAAYFDNWGNRCYIFAEEIFKNSYISKNSGLRINNLNLDLDGLNKMKCRYIFSAVPINNNNLILRNKFQKDDSWYDVYLYEIIASR